MRFFFYKIKVVSISKCDKECDKCGKYNKYENAVSKLIINEKERKNYFLQVIVGTLSQRFSSNGNGHNFTTGRLYSLWTVRTVATRITPSVPGCTSTTRPNSHWSGGLESWWKQPKFQVWSQASSYSIYTFVEVCADILHSISSKNSAPCSAEVAIVSDARY